MKLTKLTLCMVALVTVACSNSNSNSNEAQPQSSEQPQTAIEAEPNLTGKALEYYQKAKNGDAIAQYELANCYVLGQSGAEENAEKAMEWAKKSASQGCAEGSWMVGDMYRFGLGVTENETEANKWYSQAFKQATPLAENSDARAQYVLFELYYDGLSVAEDKQEAIKLLKLSADQGYADAQYELGYLHNYEDQGVEFDRAEAAKWFRKAADQGHARAQYDLGECYANGWGVEKNESEAKKWYSKAAEQGYEDAQEALKKLGN